MTDGLASIFIRLFYNGRELTDSVENMKYVYDEEDSDEIEINIRSENVGVADLPEYQEKAKLELIWGFIGGQTSGRRKITIQDVYFQFTKENVVGVLFCTEQAHTLKSATSQKIYKGKTLLDIADDKAKKHSLISQLEIPKDAPDKAGLVAKENEGTGDYLKREYNANLQKQNTPISFISGKGTLIPTNQIVKDNLSIPAALQEAKNQSIGITDNEAKDSSYARLNNQFDKQANLPQANKSDRQILEETAARDTNGPYVVDTRDDKITIRKRNFSQKPYRSYVYKGENSELLEFVPETKTRGRSGTSTSMSYSGWDPSKKNFFSGVADAADGSPTLTKLVEQRDFYQAVSKKGGGATIVSTDIKERSYTASASTGRAMQLGLIAKGDNTLVKSHAIAQIQVSVDDRVSALNQAIKDAEDPNKVGQVNNKDFYDPKSITPKAAHAKANNHRKNSELNKNKATAILWGDPLIEVGILITVINTGKKYSGNYYIKKSTHSIGKEGYYTELEMTRHGANIKSTPNHVGNKELHRDLNKEFGKTAKELKRTKVLKTKKN